MSTDYSEQDAGARALRRERVAVVGYAQRGRAQALNLRDHGCHVVVGARPWRDGWAAAERDGFAPRTPVDAVAEASTVALLVPRTVQQDVFEALAPALRPGALVLLSHVAPSGELVLPPAVDVALLAPLVSGPTLRREVQAGRAVPCAVAVLQDATGRARERAGAYAWAIGGSGAADLIDLSFEQAATSRFLEWVALCDRLTALVGSGAVAPLVDGAPPEPARAESLEEIRRAVDLMFEERFARDGEAAANDGPATEWSLATPGPRRPDLESIRPAVLVAMARRVLAELRDERRLGYGPHADMQAALR